jgi:oligoribonuclease NrnB/cAMP/cGMP phosphodiesterase (DHH superfamily)
MTNVFLYYDFNTFFKDESDAFSGNEICFSELNSEHFLIFEKNAENYNLYVSKYKSKKEVGKNKPELLEMIVENYDKSIPEHRVAIRRYFE